MKISKGFFYSLFASKELFVLHLLTSQQGVMMGRVLGILHQEISFKEKIKATLRQFTNESNEQYLFLSHAEVVQLMSSLNPDAKKQFFQKIEERHRRYLQVVNVDAEKINLHVLGNLIFTLYIYCGRDKEEYFFRDALPETKEQLIQAIYEYLRPAYQGEMKNYDLAK